MRVACMGDRRASYMVLMEGGHSEDLDRWEDNIKWIFKNLGWGIMDCIGLTHDRDRWRALVKTSMKPRVA